MKKALSVIAGCHVINSLIKMRAADIVINVPFRGRMKAIAQITGYGQAAVFAMPDLII